MRRWMIIVAGLGVLCAPCLADKYCFRSTKTGALYGPFKIRSDVTVEIGGEDFTVQYAAAGNVYQLLRLNTGTVSSQFSLDHGSHVQIGKTIFTVLNAKKLGVAGAMRSIAEAPSGLPPKGIDRERVRRFVEDRRRRAAEAQTEEEQPFADVQPLDDDPFGPVDAEAPAARANDRNSRDLFASDRSPRSPTASPPRSPTAGPPPSGDSTPPSGDSTPPSGGSAPPPFFPTSKQMPEGDFVERLQWLAERLSGQDGQESPFLEGELTWWVPWKWSSARPILAGYSDTRRWVALAGGIAALVGTVMSIAGALCMVAVMFRENPVLALTTAVLWIVGLVWRCLSPVAFVLLVIFAAKHWRESWKPFSAYLVGGFVAGMGSVALVCSVFIP